jgi:hypothetical protein
MADIFQAKGALGGVFKGTRVELVLGGGSGALKGALVQNIGINYTRNISRIWEIGSDDTYYVVGHTEGQAQLSRIIAKASNDILDALSDACSASTNVLTMSGGADLCDTDGQGERFSITATGPVLVNRSFAIDANQFMMTSQAGIMFSGLQKAS